MEGAARCRNAPRGPVKPPFAAGVARRRDGGSNSPRRPQDGSNPLDLPECRQFSWDSAVNRPREAPESSVSEPFRCRRSTAESSCGTPMHAASLTKGYGGNPPSGRSVSPPRTGPFYVPGLHPPLARPPRGAPDEAPSPARPARLRPAPAPRPGPQPPCAPAPSALPSTSGGVGFGRGTPQRDTRGGLK